MDFACQGAELLISQVPEGFIVAEPLDSIVDFLVSYVFKYNIALS